MNIFNKLFKPKPSEVETLIQNSDLFSKLNLVSERKDM